MPRAELPVDQVWGRGDLGVLPGGAPVFAQVSALDPECRISRSTRLRPHSNAVAGQHGVDAWRAVCPARPLPGRLNPLRHRRISHSPRRHRGEQRRNPVGVTMCFYKRHDLRRVGSAPGRKRARQPQISLVRFNSAFSLRSRFSSSASLLVNRSSRSPGRPRLGGPACGTSGADPQLAGHIGDRAAL